jgi:indole-3-glycerol phosphate synthase
LIAAVLTPAEVKQYTQLSHDLGMEVLLEIHDEEELGHYSPEVDLVGINNRNLNNFDISLEQYH